MATQATTTSSTTRQTWLQRREIHILLRVWQIIFLIVIAGAFYVQNETFLSLRSINSILVSSTLVLLMAIGQTYVIITGGIDLSIGWTVGLASVVSATVMRDLFNDGMAANQAIAIGVTAGLAVTLIPGLINGILIAKIKVPPFIATLGMYGVIRGAAILLTSGKNVVGDIPKEVRDILTQFGNGSVIYRIPGGETYFFSQPDNLEATQLRVLQKLIPYPVILVAVIVIIFAFILARTQFGRHTYAIGGNMEAAKRAGINVDNHLIIIYIISAFTAGMAGVLHVFRFTAGSPLVGEPPLLDSVAAVVIGGASLFGGAGRLSGTVMGALFLSMLTTGLVIIDVDAEWQFIAVGVMIIIAVLINQLESYLEKQQEHQAR